MGRGDGIVKGKKGCTHMKRKMKHKDAVEGDGVQSIILGAQQHQ